MNYFIIIFRKSFSFFFKMNGSRFVQRWQFFRNFVGEARDEGSSAPRSRFPISPFFSADAPPQSYIFFQKRQQRRGSASVTAPKVHATICVTRVSVGLRNDRSCVERCRSSCEKTAPIPVESVNYRFSLHHLLLPLIRLPYFFRILESLWKFVML